MRNSLALGSFFLLLLAAIPAFAGNVDPILKAITDKDLGQADALLSGAHQPLDQEIKAMLGEVRGRMLTDPDFAAQVMTLAGKYADNLTPPGVPPVCDEVRQIVSNAKAEMKDKPFFATVQTVAQEFAKSPVVVAAGSPNLCEMAWEDASDDAEFAQLPGLQAPGLPYRTIIQPPFTPPAPTSVE